MLAQSPTVNNAVYTCLYTCSPYRCLELGVGLKQMPQSSVSELGLHCLSERNMLGTLVIIHVVNLVLRILSPSDRCR